MFDQKSSLSVTKDCDLLYAKARKDGVETVWERHEAQQPQCGFCDMGLSCRICVMGPCRVDPFGEGPQTGVCGADADIIVARNLCRMIAAGAASHSDHGRDLVEVLAGVADGSAIGYKIRDEAKLKRLATEYGIAADGKETLALAGELAQAMMEDYGMRRKAIQLVDRAPKKRREVWKKFNLTPRGIDRETSEMMHRTHMGVDNNWVTLLLQGMRNALSDGWGGSMIATEVSDILFGVPTPRPTMVNAGVLKADQVNIVVHGHNPVVSEMVSLACQSQDLLDLAKTKGAIGSESFIEAAYFDSSGHPFLVKAASGSLASYYACYDPSSSPVGEITYQASNCTTSLRSTKHDIEPYTTGLLDALALQPSNFIMNTGTDGHEEVGLIAEKTEKVNPDLAVYDEKGKLRSVQYDRIGVVAIAAIQEQQKEIDELRNIHGFTPRSCNAFCKTIEYLEGL